MEEDEGFVSIPTIQKALGDRSRSFVYEKVLPHLELVKIGNTTNATKRSFRQYLAALPRVTIGAKVAA